MQDEPLDDNADDATRALIDRLRALPREGTEPDWSALERSIRDAVGPEMPRPWWRRIRARWLVPAAALAPALAVAALVLHGPSRRAPAIDPAPRAPASIAPLELWPDGQPVELDLAGEALLVEELAAEPALELDEMVGWDVGASPGWIDTMHALDGEALDRAEHALESDAASEKWNHK